MIGFKRCICDCSFYFFQTFYSFGDAIKNLQELFFRRIIIFFIFFRWWYQSIVKECNLSIIKNQMFTSKSQYNVLPFSIFFLFIIALLFLSDDRNRSCVCESKRNKTSRLDLWISWRDLSSIQMVNQCQTMLWYVMLSYVVSSSVMSCHVRPCCVVFCHVVSYRVKSSFAILCQVM